MIPLSASHALLQYFPKDSSATLPASRDRQRTQHITHPRCTRMSGKVNNVVREAVNRERKEYSLQ
ncbi:hypothetical protein E2C01_058334 [Portunus trituberculatus]|uniref:Uncharacterized protein n=1 Tax=Portunus trituberculatus TaxID=210409 RepID=A0A5B7H2D1_PORTR|nr:hypothetical protein [Portunus trituberculatus]